VAAQVVEVAVEPGAEDISELLAAIRPEARP
jgi:hypothetical protein